MPAGSTRRVPAVSSGALYLRSTPRTRSSVAFGTPADGALADGTPTDGALPGRVAALARAGVTDPRPCRRGTAARLPRKWRRLRLPPLTPSCSSIGALFSVPTVMRCMAASCLVFGRPTPGLRTRWGGRPLLNKAKIGCLVTPCVRRESTTYIQRELGVPYQMCGLYDRSRGTPPSELLHR